MSDVVERVAAELADANDGIIFDLLTPDEAEFYLKLARRALTAVVSALGLREERGGMGDSTYDPNQVRWVSPWVGVLSVQGSSE